MKVLHILASNIFSGAENVVCQIVDMFKSEIEMAYCSPDGDIKNSLNERGIKFLPIDKLNIKNLKKVVNEYQPDIIHAHDLKAIVMVSFLSKKYKKIGHIHGNDKTKMNKMSLKSLSLKFVAKKYNHIFWVSNSCLDEYKYRKSLPNNNSILYNIISVDNLYNKVTQDSKQYDYDIVYLGRLSYEKNCLRLLEIAKELKQKGQKFKFAIIGAGDKEQELKDYIANNHLENEVEMLGYMRNGYKIVSQAKVMLMTSLYEGTPMCALESLALGVPIVSTKTDGLVDLIKDDYNGYLYDTNLEAVSAIVKILNNEDLRLQLNANCKQFSQKYNDIETYKDKLRKVYNSKNN